MNENKNQLNPMLITNLDVSLSIRSCTGHPGFTSKIYLMKKLHLLTLVALVLIGSSACQRNNGPETKNLAVVAEATGSIEYGSWLERMNDGETPADSMRWSPRNQNRRPQWVEYEWDQPITTSRMNIYFWDYAGKIPLPYDYRITYWDGESFQPVKNLQGDELTNHQYDSTAFDPVTTTRIRLEADSSVLFSANVLEWEVIQQPGSDNHPPVLDAGGDRDVMIDGKTYLSGSARSVTGLDKTKWEKVSGPGKVNFEDGRSMETTARFSETGDYVLKLTATEGKQKSVSTLKTHVHQPPQEERLDVVYTKRYKIDNPLWNDRAKAIIVNWIPHCIDQINSHELETGGIDNFLEAAKALRGEPHGEHKGYVFSNAWVHQTIESMSIALMVDPKGDPEIIAAQEKMKKTMEDWIPKILAAQHPDGYLQTAFTLRDTSEWKERWSPDHRRNHEGYVAGYFIESAINHYTLTEGQDKRLYNAAKKLADCWVENIGPGPDRQDWYDGHQEMEQALVRFGRFVNDMEGNGQGDDYIQLAKFLLDNRGGGGKYDQSHKPVQQQYEAVGHAVRAVYNYSGMADVAAETGDVDYQSAVMSLWNNMVNKKYYVTGGIGSGETSEGFGENYSLPNRSYCESCSSCGLIFFQYKMNLAYHDAKYADLYEETMYNALMGSLDLPGENFYYTNPLSSRRARHPWHGCPCCVGNIPRTLLMVPTWTYVKGDDAIYTNLFIGSTIQVEDVAGTDVEMIQDTDYPWSGDVSITVNPKESKDFTLYVRIPDRNTSKLYTSSPRVKGVESLKVNGETIQPDMQKGYAAITRKWEKGDKVELQLPMQVQRIHADEKIEADRGKVALRYGPLIYNVEKADNPDIQKEISSEPLSTEWKEDMLHGVVALNGTWSDGTPLVAIPNYARNNRIPEDRERGREPNSIVWIEE